MSILADSATRVMVQGITGHAGASHTRLMLEYGTQVVAGVTPGKGGTAFEADADTRVARVPIFDTASQAVAATGATASVIFVPAAAAADAIMEAADSGVALVVCITEGIPALAVARARAYARERSVRLLGPNGPGILTPGEAKLGIIPNRIGRPGPVGVVSRSGTLMYEAVWQLTGLGLGQSTALGIGGDAVVGSSFVDILDLFQRDAATRAVVLIGEIGGTTEERAAEFIRTSMTKPVIAFIAGLGAPPGKRLGHAGAIVSGSSGSAEEKIRILREAGASIARSAPEIGPLTAKALGPAERRGPAS
jgi:succinyl-CoA synthetase alpha subunit